MSIDPITLILAAGVALSAGSGYMSYESSRAQEKASKAARRREQEELFIANRLAQGEALASVASLGISSSSSSVSQFLSAQRGQSQRDLEYSRFMGSTEADIARASGMSSILSAASTTVGMTSRYYTSLNKVKTQKANSNKVKTPNA